RAWRKDPGARPEHGQGAGLSSGRRRQGVHAGRGAARARRYRHRAARGRHAGTGARASGRADRQRGVCAQRQRLSRIRSRANARRRVEPERLCKIEVEGELWAMMLDPKRTFDELIDRVAPTPARAAEIKSNRVYRELSTAVSGSQEFTAVAKLYELHRDGDF